MRYAEHTATQLIAKPAKSLSNRTATPACSQAKLCETVYDGRLRRMSNDHVILNIHIEAARSWMPGVPSPELLF
jgi:hypothetical protein